MAIKTPVKATFTGSDVTGLAEYQAADFIGVVDGGTGAVTHTANSVLLGNGTNALLSSGIQIVGTTLSSSDSTLITIDEGLTVTGNTTITGNLTVNGTTTTINSTTVDVVNSFRFEGSTANDYETNLTVVDPTADRTITLPNATGTVSLLDNTETLTNKTIDADNNTITNIGDDELSSGISAIKIGNGDVDNTELSYLNGVTSSIQTQIDTKASTAFAIAQAVALG
jgi:hypothetical protein